VVKILAYEKPKCECGNELFLYTQSVYGEITKVTNRGKLFKKQRSYYERGGVDARLRCGDCWREYEIDHDSKERIVRGHVF
jgi:hypothetical protein